MTRAQRSDAVRNRAAVLSAAQELFASTSEPGRVSMDDVAARAGVGKGTLFRAFGSRAELIKALCSRHTEPIRQATESGPPPLGPSTDPRTRIAAILDALLVMHLDNSYLMLAAEDGSVGSGLYEMPDYQWAHQLLRELLHDAGRAEDNELLAHILLASVRTSLVKHLVVRRRISRRRFRTDLADIVALILAPPTD